MNGPFKVESKGVTTTETTFEIVEQLSKMDNATLTELAKETGLAKSTVYKHLKTLEQYNFVVQRGNGYHIGYNFLTIGGATRDESRFCDTVRPKLHSIANSTGLMALFAVIENGEGVFLYRFNDRLRLGKAIPTGLRFDLHQNASGKAMLAQLDDTKVKAILRDRGLAQMTNHTVTNSETLFSQLEEIRERGYALNTGERKEGLWAVASALTNPQTEQVGAIAVSGPASKLTEERLHKLGPNVMGVVEEIQLQLRYR